MSSSSRCSPRTRSRRTTAAEPLSVPGTSEWVSATRVRNCSRKRWRAIPTRCGTTCARPRATSACRPGADSEKKGPALLRRPLDIASRQPSAGGALRLLADGRPLLGLGQAAADVHEAAALGPFELTPPGCMGREARARRDEPSDDDVLLESAQVVLEPPHR